MPRSLSEINRSEMPKSVVFSLLVRWPRFFPLLQQHCVGHDEWRMRPVDKGDSRPIELKCADQKLMASANLHIRRDLERSSASFVKTYGAECPKNEIDVVAVIPCKVAIGFELKWKSRTSKIEQQLKNERACLQLLARYYMCPFTSMVAVLPTKIHLDEADAVMTLADVAELIDSMRREHPDFFLEAASQEFEATKHIGGWETVPNVESLLSRADRSKGDEWVGYIDGLEDLRSRTLAEIRGRQSWKIALKKGHDRNWYPLQDVAQIIRKKLGP
jgi:hypothetical protein